eukprot:3100743-Pyramimonas_sp.AAC.1
MGMARRRIDGFPGDFSSAFASCSVAQRSYAVQCLLYLMRGAGGARSPSGTVPFRGARFATAS